MKDHRVSIIEYYAWSSDLRPSASILAMQQERFITGRASHSEDFRSRHLFLAGLECMLLMGMPVKQIPDLIHSTRVKRLQCQTLVSSRAGSAQIGREFYGHAGPLCCDAHRATSSQSLQAP